MSTTTTQRVAGLLLDELDELFDGKLEVAPIRRHLQVLHEVAAPGSLPPALRDELARLVALPRGLADREFAEELGRWRELLAGLV